MKADLHRTSGRRPVVRHGVRGVLAAVVWSVAALLTGCADRAELPTTPPVQPTVPTPDVSNVVPSAQFAVTPRWPAPGDTVTFDARYSHDDDGQVVQYRWLASNGISMTTGAVTRVVFRTAGTYSVTLTAIDDGGDSSSTTLTLPVSASGAPVGAVSATQSSLTLASPTVAGGANVVATVTARTAAGITISGAPVGVSARGLRVRASPSSGTASGGGVFTSSLSSGVAQSVIVRAVANFTALADTVPLTITSATAASVSSVRLTQSALASAGDSAFLEVTARDSAGNPVPNIAVSAIGSPAGLVVSNAGTTDANGRRVLVLKSTACGGAHTITVTAGGVTLASAPSLQSGIAGPYTVCSPGLWLDASDYSTFTIEAGTRITQWRDKSGYGLHASATSGSTARPQYAATTFNGLPAVAFAGGANNTATPEHLTLASFPMSSLSAVTYFLVYRRTTVNSCDRVFDLGSSTNVHAMFTTNCSGFQRYTQTTSGIGGETSASAAATANGVTHLVSIIHAGAVTLRVNGATVATSPAIPPPSAVGTPANRWLGRSQYAADGYLSGQIAEVLAYPKALTNLEYAAVEQALMRKWGLGTVSITQGNNQSAAAGTSPTSQLGFRVADAQGNGISGATLTLQVTTGGGRLAGATTLTVTTDVNGNASVPTGSWVLDYGTNVITVWLSATAGQGQSITLTGTGTLPANLVMQYDASKASTLYRASSCTGTLAAPGDSVGCWQDNSLNVRHVTQATAATRPTVTTFGSTGRTALQFVKTRENYLQSTAAGLDALANGPRTIVAVARGNTTENNVNNNAGAIVVFPGYHSGLHFYGYPSAVDVVASQWRSTSTLLWSDSPYTANSAVVASQVLSTAGGGLTNTVTVNGSGSVTTSAAGLTSPSYPNLMRIGQANVAPTTADRWRLDGQVAEVLVFNRALTNAERLEVERYAGWKWGVTIP